ncbi:hypothetical protein GCM10027073_06740 [Streptomyces chlorus]|uniref:Uncharacterized protein n=1 Tax=Streptomyces chlorus TaxID=887452 RepID=A0ABW1DSD2_9ACTN
MTRPAAEFLRPRAASTVPGAQAVAALAADIHPTGPLPVGHLGAHLAEGVPRAKGTVTGARPIPPGAGDSRT